jgi:hypothetical protein
VLKKIKNRKLNFTFVFASASASAFAFNVGVQPFTIKRPQEQKQ